MGSYIKKQVATQNRTMSEPEIAEFVFEIFAKEDADGDGVISYAEFHGPRHEELK